MEPNKESEQRLNWQSRFVHISHLRNFLFDLPLFPILLFKAKLCFMMHALFRSGYLMSFRKIMSPPKDKMPFHNLNDISQIGNIRPEDFYHELIENN